MTTPITRLPFANRLSSSLAEWETANPALAASWNAALEEEAQRQKSVHEAKEAAALAAATRQACTTVGMPLRALEAVERLKPTEALAALEANAKELEAGMVLLAGPPGTGKSVACVKVAHDVMAAAMRANPNRVAQMPDRVAIFVRAVTLARCSAYGPEAARELRRYYDTRLLVIDDLGAETKSPIWEMLLFEILDTRHGDMKPTLLTSNVGAKDFAERYGTRLIERIREGGAAAYLNGESMRGQS